MKHSHYFEYNEASYLQDCKTTPDCYAQKHELTGQIFGEGFKGVWR